MPKAATKPKSRSARRGTLARPLDALLFLLPLILFYEFTSLSRSDRVISFEFLYKFLSLFGQVGFWAPGLAVIVILLATHAASGDRWVIHWRRVGLMYVESLALSVPLLLLSWSVPLTAGGGGSGMLHRLALGIGAGVYEELIFRLIVISVMVIVFADMLRLHRGYVAAAAVLVSSLAFAAHHHPPIGLEPFRAVPFLFRTISGIYLAVVFWFRGYGPAAGCHAAYNVDLVLLDALVQWRG